MTIFSYNKYESIRYFSVVILVLFFIHVLFLYLNTLENEFDPISFLKIFIPISILLLLTIVNIRLQKLILTLLISLLIVHITIASFTYIINNGLTIKGDRLIIELLGRSPGATAHAFAILIISMDYFVYKDKSSIILPYLIKTISVVAILLSTSRVYLLFLLIYFLFRNVSIVNSRKIIRYLIIVFIVFIFLINTEYFS